MPFFMCCPNCRNRYNLSFPALMSTCPKCLNSFRVDNLDEGFSWEPDSPKATAEMEQFEQEVKTVPSPAARSTAMDEIDDKKPAPAVAPAPVLPQPLQADEDYDDSSLPQWL